MSLHTEGHVEDPCAVLKPVNQKGGSAADMGASVVVARAAGCTTPSSRALLVPHLKASHGMRVKPRLAQQLAVVWKLVGLAQGFPPEALACTVQQ